MRVFTVYVSLLYIYLSLYLSCGCTDPSPDDADTLILMILMLMWCDSCVSLNHSDVAKRIKIYLFTNLLNVISSFISCPLLSCPTPYTIIDSFPFSHPYCNIIMLRENVYYLIKIYWTFRHAPWSLGIM